MTGDIQEILGTGQAIPVVQLDDTGDAVPMAHALLAGGIRMVEITLRTAAALDAVRAIAREVPQIAVGAGTLLTPDDLAAAEDAGAAFFVSPGLTPRLLEAAEKRGLPYLPGVSTATEAMMALDHGFQVLKFFPAATLGTAAIKALYGPLPQAIFCATGGITNDNALDFIALPNVGWVGASWIASPDLLAAKDWRAIEANARYARSL